MPTDNCAGVTFGAVVVNYNYEAYVGSAVRSVLDQNVLFDEVVVVDDGSTDNSLEVLSDLAVRVIRKRNSGQLGACITGLRALSTDYVYFLDADDLAEPDLVESLVKVCEGLPVKMQFPLRGIDAAAQPTGSCFPTWPARYGSPEMRADNEVLGFYLCPPTSGNVYLRTALLSLPLEDLDPRDFIDGPATLALPYLGEVLSLVDPLAAYRVHDRNHSQWSRPTEALLSFEIEWFGRRWVETSKILGLPEAPLKGIPLYVVERELMLSSFPSRCGCVLAVICRYLALLFRSRMRAPQKVLLAAWAIAFAVPSRTSRWKLVKFRRSTAGRPRWLRLISGALLFRTRSRRVSSLKS